VVSFGTSYAASNPHGPDENIRLDDFLQSIKYFGRIIHHLGGGVKSGKISSGINRNSGISKSGSGSRSAA
jgi:hypothetical protein